MKIASDQKKTGGVDIQTGRSATWRPSGNKNSPNRILERLRAIPVSSVKTEMDEKSNNATMGYGIINFKREKGAANSLN